MSFLKILYMYIFTCLSTAKRKKKTVKFLNLTTKALLWKNSKADNHSKWDKMLHYNNFFS